MQSQSMVSRIPSLDGIRAVSVLLVVISHCGFLYRLFYLANYAQLIPLGGDTPNGLIIL